MRRAALAAIVIAALAGCGGKDKPEISADIRGITNLAIINEDWTSLCHALEDDDPRDTDVVAYIVDEIRAEAVAEAGVKATCPAEWEEHTR